MIRSASKPYRQCRVSRLLAISSLHGGDRTKNSLVRLGLGQSNELLNLVFSFSRNVVSAKNNLDIPPLGILRDPLANIVFKVITQPSHKWRSCHQLCSQKGNIPGVIQLESNAFSSGKVSPFLSACSLCSRVSLAVLNRRLRCWFILALGATPSIAMKNTFCGLIFVNK